MRKHDPRAGGRKDHAAERLRNLARELEAAVTEAMRVREEIGVPPALPASTPADELGRRRRQKPAALAAITDPPLRK